MNTQKNHNQSQKEPGRTAPNKNAREEVKYYGIHACIKLWERRPNDVIRIYVETSKVKQLSPMLKWCAAQKKAYHVVATEELNRITDSVHHEGVCLLALAPLKMHFEDLLATLSRGNKKMCLLYLDGVQNPHNVGSVLRICAHFGVPYILGPAAKLPALSPSALRVAKGGGEVVQMIPLAHPKKAILELKQKGFVLLASSSHKGSSVYDYPFPERTILALGGESEGVTAPILEIAKDTLLIPGTGEVESLNVAIACGLFVGEYWRQTYTPRS